MMKSVVKNLSVALASHSIELTVHTLDHDEAYLTVEKEGVAYSLVLSDDYASLAETYFNNDIGYDEKVLFEEEGFEVVGLAKKIADLLDAQLDEISKEVFYMMSLEEENNF